MRTIWWGLQNKQGDLRTAPGGPDLSRSRAQARNLRQYVRDFHGQRGWRVDKVKVEVVK